MALATGDSPLSSHQNIMAQLDDVIQHVLSFLPMKTLQTCARVCHKWNSAIKRIKKHRIQLAWILHRKEKDHNQESIEDTINNLSSQPKLALLFCSSRLYHDDKITCVKPRRRSIFTRSTEELMEVDDFLERQLPACCLLLGVVTDGIVGTDENMLAVIEIEEEPAFSCLLIPQRPGLELFSFAVSSDDLETLVHPNDPDKLSSLIRIPKDQKPKLVLLFRSPHAVNDTFDMATEVMLKYKNVVVAGGVVDDLIPTDDESETEDVILGLAFCGENMKVASVLLEGTTKDTEAFIARLKSAHIPEQNAIGFMFACIAKGRSIYGKHNVEADAFRKVFPTVPLFGLFANGEIGHDYLPDYSKPEGDTKMNPIGPLEDEEEEYEARELLNHSYSTVFVLVSLGS